MAQTIQLRVSRYSPERDTQPYFQTYEVPVKEEWVILDALNYIKDKIDGTLTFRWSCRMGICGSCGYMVNNEPKL
jgi:fumarate reductase iron-sulfur subunit